MMNLSRDEFRAVIFGYSSNHDIQAIDNVYANQYIKGNWSGWNYKYDALLMALQVAEKDKQIRQLQEALDL